MHFVCVCRPYYITLSWHPTKLDVICGRRLDLFSQNVVPYFRWVQQLTETL